MKENQVFIIKDRYVVKKAEKNILKAEKYFIENNKKIKTPQILYYNEEQGYIVYEYIRGDIIHEINNVDNCLLCIYNIINNYEKIKIDGCGSIFNLKDNWISFVKDEFERQSIYINDNILKKEIIQQIEVLSKYNIQKRLIHGDLGGFNIICKNGKIQGIIDPRCLIGDPIYDFIYFIFSSYNIAKKIDYKSIFYILKNEPKEKVLALMHILLYDRIARENKNNTIYKSEYYNILNNLKKIML